MSSLFVTEETEDLYDKQLRSMMWIYDKKTVGLSVFTHKYTSQMVVSILFVWVAEEKKRWHTTLNKCVNLSSLIILCFVEMRDYGK